MIGYKNDDKAFQSFIILEKGKALVYSENTKIETNATPKLEWVDNFVSSNTTNVYKVALGNSGIWEIYQLNPNQTNYFSENAWTKVEGIRGYGVGSDTPNDMFIILCILGITYALTAVFNFISSRVSMRLSQATIRKIRKDLFDNLVFLPIRYFDTHQHGDIMSRVTNDVDNISNTISQSLTSLISGVLTVIGALVIMLIYSPLLTLVSLSTLLLTVFSTRFLSKHMRKFFRIQRSLVGEINAQVEEMVIGHKTVKAYNKQEDVEEEFNQISKNLRKYGSQGQNRTAILSLRVLAFLSWLTIPSVFSTISLISVHWSYAFAPAPYGLIPSYQALIFSYLPSLNSLRRSTSLARAILDFKVAYTANSSGDA